MPLPADKHFGARIVERRDLSPDLWLLRLEPDAPFKFLAGQYATLGIERNGKKIERPYSIVSSPYEQTLEFFVELVPHGEFTPLLHMLKQGDTLLCRKVAKGRFMLDLRSGRTQHLLVSTVTGIAPFVSYVRTLYRDWKAGDASMPGNHKLYCLQGASRSWEFGYREELQRYVGTAAGIHNCLSLRSSKYGGERSRNPSTWRLEERCDVRGAGRRSTRRTRSEELAGIAPGRAFSRQTRVRRRHRTAKHWRRSERAPGRRSRRPRRRAPDDRMARDRLRLPRVRSTIAARVR